MLIKKRRSQIGKETENDGTEAGTSSSAAVMQEIFRFKTHKSSLNVHFTIAKELSFNTNFTALSAVKR